MYLLCVYIPESHLESVKDAIFKEGGGQIGSYDSCSWQVAGKGQFRPLQGSHPFLGQIENVEKVNEYRIEVVVEESKINSVIAAMKISHPYEEPAYHYYLVNS